MTANFICLITLSALDSFSESCDVVRGSAATIFFFYITYQNWNEIINGIDVCLILLHLLTTLEFKRQIYLAFFVCP